MVTPRARVFVLEFVEGIITLHELCLQNYFARISPGSGDIKLEILLFCVKMAQQTQSNSFFQRGLCVNLMGLCFLVAFY